MLSRDIELANEYLEKGNKYYAEGKYSQALNEYVLATTCAVNYAPIYFKLGLVNQALKDYSHALYNYKQAITLGNNPKSTNTGAHQFDLADAHFKCATLNTLSGDFEQAKIDYATALKLNRSYETYPLFHNNLGSLHLEQGFYASAVKAFDKAIALDSKDANAYFNRGRAYFQQGLFQLAEENFSQSMCLENAGAAPHYYYCRGINSLERNKEKAFQRFETALACKDIPYWLVILCRIQLVKNNSDNITSNIRELRFLLPYLAAKADITSADKFLAFLASFYAGEYKMCVKIFKTILDNSYFVPDYLRKDFFNVLIDKALWEKEPILYADFKKVDGVKEHLLVLLDSYKVSKYLQIAYCQSLIAKTLLGSIFAIAQGWIGMKPSLNSSFNKRWIAARLEEEIFKNGILLDDDTKDALSADINLQNDLAANNPTLNKQLFTVNTVANPGIIPPANWPDTSSEHLSFFKRGDTNICTTIATPNGRKPNPEWDGHTSFRAK